MKRRVYYRIEMQLASPLSIGNGRNESTDHDVVRGKNGKPYIPATSIVGVFRHTLDSNEDLRDNIFGTIAGNKSQNSKVIFYDGYLLSDGISSVRDSVKLENKVGVDGAKFDMEVIETGAKFATLLEISDQEKDVDNLIEEMLSKLSTGFLRFGAKTSRGYGAVKISSLKKIVFDLEQPSQLNLWLDFDPYTESSWADIETYDIKETYTDYIKISLQLVQKSAISIREYSTDVGKDGETLPDYKHIALKDETSVIPGTSWAGAFRARYMEFAGEDAADALFGYVKKDGNTTKTEKSRIIFSECQITDDTAKTITRNSIDRFTAATKDSALYTERTSYNGKTKLDILLKDDATDREKAILSAVLLDLHHGFLAVGGLTSVGRGLFHIDSLTVDGADCTANLEFEDAELLLEAE